MAAFYRALYAEEEGNEHRITGSWFSQEFAGEGIPTLEEAMEFAKGRIDLNIEIKNMGDGSSLPERVAEMVEEFEMGEQCVISP